MKKEAKWHKSCHTKFNITKLKRAERKQASIEDIKTDCSPPTKKIRLSRSSEPVTKESCYFCENKSEPLRAVSTYQVDSRV